MKHLIQIAACLSLSLGLAACSGQRSHTGNAADNSALGSGGGTAAASNGDAADSSAPGPGDSIDVGSKTSAAANGDVGDSSVDAASRKDRHLTEFHGIGSGDAMVALSLCELAKEYPAGGGTYKVTDIVQNPYKYWGKTLVYLKSESSWSSNPPHDPVTTVVGGPTPNGGYLVGESGVNVRVGETIGALLVTEGPSSGGADTRPYYLWGVAIFENDAGNGYTNGDLFVGQGLTLKQIGKKVADMYQGIRSGKGCPYDVKPAPTPQPTRPDAGRTHDVQYDIPLHGDGG